MLEWKIGIFKYILPYYFLMAESQCVEMSILAGESQRLMLRINELEEIITELKKEHAEQANINSKQAKLITADQCDHCGSTNLEECGVEKQVIREHVLMRKIIGTKSLDLRMALNITSTSLQSSLRGGYKEEMSTMSSKNCSSMSFV